MTRNSFVASLLFGQKEHTDREVARTKLQSCLLLAATSLNAHPDSLYGRVSMSYIRVCTKGYVHYHYDGCQDVGADQRLGIVVKVLYERIASDLNIVSKTANDSDVVYSHH